MYVNMKVKFRSVYVGMKFKFFYIYVFWYKIEIVYNEMLIWK
jgi:hypothetical protein